MQCAIADQILDDFFFVVVKIAETDGIQTVGDI